MPVLKPTCLEHQLHSQGSHSDEKLVHHKERVAPAPRHTAVETQHSRAGGDRLTQTVGVSSLPSQALPGLPFVLPPEQDKLDPAQMDEEALLQRLAALSGPLDKALSASIRGLSPVAAREVSCRATGMNRTDVESLKLDW